MTTSGRSRKRRASYWLYIYGLLGLVLAVYVFVRIVPIIEVARLGFSDWNLISPNARWVGLSNYLELFRDTLFKSALVNSTLIALGTVTASVLLGLAVSALINSLRGRQVGWAEAAFFIPHVVSLVPAAVAWKALLDARTGLVNQSLEVFGIAPLTWLSDPKLAVVSIIILVTWQTVGYNVLVFLVGLRNMNTSVLEAAQLDGTTYLQRFWYIQLPLLRPLVLYVVVTNFIYGFNTYGQAYVLASDAQGAPGYQVRVLVMDIVENAFRNYRMGYAAAETVLFALVVMAVTALVFVFTARSNR